VIHTRRKRTHRGPQLVVRCGAPFHTCVWTVASWASCADGCARMFTELRTIQRYLQTTTHLPWMIGFRKLHSSSLAHAAGGTRDREAFNSSMSRSEGCTTSTLSCQLNNITGRHMLPFNAVYVLQLEISQSHWSPFDTTLSTTQ
jgi:hypothetical protein